MKDAVYPGSFDPFTQHFGVVPVALGKFSWSVTDHFLSCENQVEKGSD